MKTLSYFLALLISLAATAADPVTTQPSTTRTVKLAWDASPNATNGYRVYWGSTSGVYAFKEDVGDVLAYTVTLPKAGTTFFVVTALAEDLESAPSNEVSDSWNGPQSPGTLRIEQTTTTEVKTTTDVIVGKVPAEWVKKALKG